MMAGGHNISSTSLNENLLDSASSMNESVRIQSSFVNDTKYCNMSDKLKLSWTGDLESLRCFIAKDIKFHGTWKSPGGERKSCTDGKTTITWWRKKKTIRVCGIEAENIKRSFCCVLMGNHHIMNSEVPLVNNCSCNCMNAAVELEGVKLDAVIAEREMKSTIAQNSLAIENLQTQLNHFADLVVGLKCYDPNLNVVKTVTDEYN